MIPLLPLLASLGTGSPKPLDFNRDVRPILSEKCFRCHGPDERQRGGHLRLDVQADATAELKDGRRAIVPGDVEKSEAIRRIHLDDPDDIMPPPEAKKPLTPEEKATLDRWVREGAGYSAHWAFIAPKKAEVADEPSGNPIDAFVDGRLAAEGLTAAAPATREVFLRRVTLDLTGLPPSLEEQQAFLADTSPNAVERVVDRLLASPRFGEKWALLWLDLARYADTHGYHLDSGREMWRWREWVIDAFNANKPFDAFVVEQLAGDLLPDATPEQIVATGFCRNNMINFEGGAIAEEYLNAYIVDRVNTFSTVFLGLTMNCCQCHDHKYDPLTMRDFYQLYAYFNAVPEKGLDGNRGNAEPVMAAPSRAQAETLAQIRTALRQAESVAAGSQSSWTILDPKAWKSMSGTEFQRLEDKSLVADGPNPTSDTYELSFGAPAPEAGPVSALRLECLPNPAGNVGRAGNGNFVLTGVAVKIDGKDIAIRSGRADHSQAGFPLENALDASPTTGWAVDGDKKKDARTAWLFLAEPVVPKPDGTVQLTLKFESGYGNHAIGRVRLATAGGAGLAASEKAAALRADLVQAEKNIPTVMVMKQMEQPRDTFILHRGQYDMRGDRIGPGIPSIFGRLPADAPANRLALARWLVSPENPLLARVTVNRFWATFFGTGLVKTTNDFGSQGDWPSHPGLLDWLAADFRDGGWDVKRLFRRIVTSAAYHRSAAATPAELSRDPANRLLARGPRNRLPAELIRDTALAAAGLLDHRIGGPSASPYQPPGLWEELNSRGDSTNWTGQFYVQSHGPDLYRRGLYTYWKRTCPPPNMVTFDAPDRETCTAQRSVTNTPLQALTLLNDPVFVEAARGLASRLLTDFHGSDADRLTVGFRLVCSRTPSHREVAVLEQLLSRVRQRYAADPAAAEKLLAVGEAPRQASLAAPELAAWTAVAQSILNLDEAIAH